MSLEITIILIVEAVVFTAGVLCLIYKEYNKNNEENNEDEDNENNEDNNEIVVI